MVNDVLGQVGVNPAPPPANVLMKLSKTLWGLPKTGFPPTPMSGKHACLLSVKKL